MDRFPEEIWSDIFQFACCDIDDGGATGHSLSLVSKDVKRISYPVQLHSVALPTLDKMVAFMDMLRAHPERARDQCIRHLSVSHHCCGHGKRNDHHFSTLITTVDLLLHAVGQQLHSLHLHFTTLENREFPIELPEMPALRELSIDAAAMYCEFPVPLPSLRHLRISNCETVRQLAAVSQAMHNPLSALPELRYIDISHNLHLNGATKVLTFLLGIPQDALNPLSASHKGTLGKESHEKAVDKIEKIVYKWQTPDLEGIWNLSVGLFVQDVNRLLKLERLAKGRLTVVQPPGYEQKYNEEASMWAFR
ncbi:hypothetical protein EW146_g7820 [Bondarzewia mesenterica]|uniref:F-box domain-containing protein n=1 Tax=Bondarzewia mesenterica TaxID=1095465 RepID=A0A4S4LPT8_9AGAM|nr:hypothetical protein EW146_g7820 [Bondarzewia mesenterica]